MSDVEIIKRVTNELCKNDHDAAVLEQYFAPEFTFWSNGQQGDLSEFSARMVEYGKNYKNMTIPNWDELFATDHRVVVSYIFEAHKHDGATNRSAVMAIWQLRDGKIVALRQVLAGV
ncbi:MAG: nuclear transport factor 2 family protein [Methyloligellaceae bacterium]